MGKGIMSDLIDRQAAINALVEELAYKPEGYWDSGLNQYDVEVVLNQQPSIDVTPVRYGHWEECEVLDENCVEVCQSARCSICGRYHTTPYMYYFDQYKYCPNCGARMDGEQNATN